MSRITWTLEQRTHDDPWTQQQETYTVRVAWACECGATSPRRLRRRQTLEQTAAWHLLNHGAPRALRDGACPCGWVETRPVASMSSEVIEARHDSHHERWLLEVWDA